MKFKFLTILIGAVAILASCSSDNKGTGTVVEPGETRSAFLKLNTTLNGTRAVEETATGTTAELYSAIIYFVDGSADPLVYEIMTAAPSGADLTLAELEEGVLVEDISSSVTQVYVVGNYDVTNEFGAGATFPTSAGLNTLRLSQVKSVLLNIQEVSYGQLADGTDVGNLITVMDGQESLYVYEVNGSNQWGGTNTPADGDWYTSVTISPVVARLEIVEIAYTGDLTSFTLEGIYINNYYQEVPISLDLDGLGTMNNGSNPLNYDVNNAAFKYMAYSTLYDIVDEDATGDATFTPGTDLVWAYQVFGNSNPVPHIILKLTDVVDDEGVNVGDRYVTVSGFMNGATQLQTLRRNTVYKIASLAFTDDDLELIPEPEDINVWVHVTVQPWATVNITPII